MLKGLLIIIGVYEVYCAVQYLVIETYYKNKGWISYYIGYGYDKDFNLLQEQDIDSKAVKALIKLRTFLNAKGYVLGLKLAALYFIVKYKIRELKG